MFELRPDIRVQVQSNTRPVIVDCVEGTRAVVDPLVLEVLRALDGAPSLEDAWQVLERRGLADGLDRDGFGEFVEASLSRYFATPTHAAASLRQAWGEARRVREERLLALVRWAGAKVPYYQARWGHLLPELRGIEDARRIPLLSREEVRAQFPTGLLAAGFDYGELISSGRAAVEYSSGSTSVTDRVPSLHLVSELGPSAVSSVPFFSRTDRAADFTPPVCSGHECSIEQQSREERTFGGYLLLPSAPDPMYMSEAALRGVHAELWDWAPQALLGNPWYLMSLLRSFDALGLPLPDSIEVVQTLTEFATAPVRRYLARKTGLVPFDGYSSTECGTLAVTCPLGRYHLAEQSYVEILRRGRPAGVGEFGEIVVTTLDNEAMPLVRYRQRDLAAPTESCECGIPSPTIELLGRQGDCLVAGSRVVPVRVVDRGLERVAALLFYRLLQQADETVGADIGVDPESGASAETVVADVRRVLAECDLKVGAVTVVERLRTQPSMKFSPLVSRVPQLRQRVAQALELEDDASSPAL
ncbi:MAG: phenylacetate--CoA ligase family protein [Deltaproteobacteria bacterium]|nr:phenylacetate--CoA ligase family protein [Deltaproteobacteria bacterium]